MESPPRFPRNSDLVQLRLATFGTFLFIPSQKTTFSADFTHHPVFLVLPPQDHGRRHLYHWKMPKKVQIFRMDI